MSDDPVKQAIVELQDLVRCRCLPAYTIRKLRDPECDCDSAENVKVVVDRIEELEAKLEGAVSECERIGRLWHDAEAKLAKAVALIKEAEESLARISGFFFDTFPRKQFRAFLAELKGEK